MNAYSCEHGFVGEQHGISSTTAVDPAVAEQVARIMGALSTASRVRLLSCLREGPRTVGELTESVEMTQSAVSHQLRVLRDLGLVSGSRERRNVLYALFDPHVARLLDEALRHAEHLRSDHHQEHTVTTPHAHDTAHDHQHEHEGQEHSHAHDAHEHEHVEHEHAHEHDRHSHAHPHPHEAGLEESHEHGHS